jgi:hypothetical protein
VGDEQTVPGQEPGAEPAGQEQAGDGERQETFDAQYVKQLRDEAASYRRKMKELETKVSGFEQAQMTEADKLKAQAAAAQAQAQAAQEALRQAKAEAAVARAAAKHGVDATLAARLVDVEFDEAGEPTGVEAAVAHLLDEYPHLKPAAGVTLGATNPQRKATLTMDEVRRMSPAQINERWTEVEAAMKAARE